MRNFFFLLTLATLPAVLFGDWMPPQQALNKLIEGNERYVSEKLKFSNRSTERRMGNIESQTPFAVIVGCSDSRTAPEVIFDQGIGDLFVVRVAGNVAGPVELNSIDYAVIHLDTALILVMGHQNCGAIQAVMNGQTQDIEAIAKLVAPTIPKATDLTDAIKKNAQYVASTLRKNPLFAKKIEEKKVEIHPAYYDFTTGKVEILQNH